MSFYKYKNEVYFYDDEEDAPEEFAKMTQQEIDAHLELQSVQIFPNLTPIQFDLKLRKNGMLQSVRDYVKTDEVMNIAYNRATFFCRTDPFIETARIALNLTNEQIDLMWLSD